MIYDETYYNTKNYSDYIERDQRYYHLAKELDDLFNKLTLVDKSNSILDYGCAFGFLIEGFTKLGYNNIKGYDISEYAINIAKSRGNEILSNPIGIYKLIIALDVFEHMSDEVIRNTFSNISSTYLIGRIPCAHDKDCFHLDISRADPSHINCKNKEEWKALFHQLGYKTFFHLNLFSIYDSPGVFSFLAIA